MVTQTFPLSFHSFLQSEIWAEFRGSLGWKPHRIDSISVLERRVPLGKTFLYSPEVSSEPTILSTLIPSIRTLGRQQNSIFFRLELVVDKSNPIAGSWDASLREHGFIKAFESVQPDDRQVIPLHGGAEAAFQQMKSKGRYHIRIAAKAGVQVRQATIETLSQDVHTFYHLLASTAKRQKFSIRSESYFITLCQLLYARDAGRVFVAEYQGHTLAAAIITLYDHYASYLYGASSNVHSETKAPYLLHWEAMRWAMDQGAEWYDLLAIRPDTAKEGQSHPYDGITQFKERFGGTSVHLLGSWDLPLQPTWYNIFKMAEELRRR